MKAIDPDGFRRAVEADNGLRRPDSVYTRDFLQELFVPRTCRPLEVIDFSSLTSDTLDPMAVGECQGMYGV